MRFDIITIFPDTFSKYFDESIIKRAREKGVVDINIIDLRDYANNKHKQVDDYTYGGGPGMILKPEPLAVALDEILKKSDRKPYVIYLTAQGIKYDQKKVSELSEKKHIVLICGRYEGIDERIVEEYVDLELSIGDYIITGGELPAMIVVDSVIRLLPGAVGNSESITRESFENDLLDFPQYTRPENFRGKKVPGVLLAGDHAKIDKWREEKALGKTLKNRPDLLLEKDAKKG